MGRTICVERLSPEPNMGMARCDETRTAQCDSALTALLNTDCVQTVQEFSDLKDQLQQAQGVINQICGQMPPLPLAGDKVGGQHLATI